MTKTIDDAFGPLRGTFDQGPSPEAWGELIGMLSEWSGQPEFGEKLLPYVSEALDAWPDALRVAPSSWFTSPDTTLLRLGRRVDAWFACPDTNPHSGASMLQVLRLFPDQSVVSVPIQARTLVPSTLSWVKPDTSSTSGTYIFDGHALRYDVYISSTPSADQLIEGRGVVIPGGFDVKTYSHATDHHGHKVYQVFTNRRPALAK